MYTIDRGLVVVKPKQPYLNWIRALPDPDDKITLEVLRDGECLSILIPEDDDDSTGMRFVESNCDWIFEMSLKAWWTDDKDWPAKRDWATFREWFDVEFHSIVIDPLDEPIEKEEY